MMSCYICDVSCCFRMRHGTVLFGMHLDSIPVPLESLYKAVVKDRTKKLRPKYWQTVKDEVHQTKHTYLHVGIPVPEA